LGNTPTNLYLKKSKKSLKEIQQMSKIAISDLHRSESEYGLIDLSNEEQKAVNGGVVVIIIDHGDHIHIVVIQ